MKLSNQLLTVIVIALCWSIQPTKAADQILSTVDDVSFQTRDQSVWSSADDGTDFPARFEATSPVLLDLLNLDESDISFSETVTVGYQTGPASRTGPLQADLFCADGEFPFSGSCYSCPSVFDPALSTTVSLLQNQAVCVNPGDVNPPTETGPAEVSLLTCPASHPNLDIVNGVCFESCPTGAEYVFATGRCESVSTSAPSCSHLGHASGTSSSARFRVDPLTGNCIEEDTQHYCGKRTRSESNTSTFLGDIHTHGSWAYYSWSGSSHSKDADALIPEPPNSCDSGWTVKRSASKDSKGHSDRDNYYDCLSSFNRDILVGDSSTVGICVRNRAVKAQCPAGTVLLGSVCTGLDSTAPDTVPVPSKFLCDAPGFLDDQKPGFCFACKANEIPVPSNPLTAPGAADACVVTRAGVLTDNQPSLGCDAGQFPALGADGALACYQCDNPELLPLPVQPDGVPPQCFGLSELPAGDPDGFTVGMSGQGGVGLRDGMELSFEFDGGAVDVNYQTRVAIDITPENESAADTFRITTRLVDEATSLDMQTSWPSASARLRHFNESYNQMAVTVHYLAFDENGLPAQATEVMELWDANSTDPEDPFQEIGDLGYGVVYDEIFSARVGAEGSVEITVGDETLDEELFGIPWRLHLDLPPLPSFQVDADLPTIQTDFLPDLKNYNELSGKMIAKPPKGTEFTCLFGNNDCFKIILAEVYPNLVDLNTPPRTDIIGRYYELECGDHVTSCKENEPTSITQYIGPRNRDTQPLPPWDPDWNPFWVAPHQTVDLLRVDLDIDGIVSYVSGYPALGFYRKRTVPSVIPKKKKTLWELEANAMDLDFANIFSMSKEVEFTPNLELKLTFSKAVTVDNEKLREITIKPGDDLVFTHPGGELDV
ncbi:MAG: hypothetical protein KDI36_07865, partial [Pseudomonadales bacterium]|nr:hypothetical protein [Pseudomonadales bacterium]